MMSSQTWLPFFIFLILSNISSTFVTAQRYFCLGGNYTSNGTYNNNLNTIFSSLSSNMSYQGFHNASLGQIPDRVNVIALCRGDTQPDQCRSCIQDATHELVKLCPNQRQAILWQEFCTLRYSNNSSIFGDLADFTAPFLLNMYNATSPQQFNEGLRTLLDQLRAQAASGGSLMKVAAGNQTGPDFQTIYGLLQCSPDISQDNCSRCLISAAQRIPGCCADSIGARILQPSCTLRYETYPFYNLTRIREALATPFGSRPGIGPAPLPSGSSPPAARKHRLRLILLTGFGAVLIVITSIIILVMVIKRRKNIKNAYNHKNMEIFLKNHEEGHLGWEKLFEIAVGIARGLEYLHRGCNMRILHLDIKPHNILLDKNFHPKIADFGLAKLCPDTASIMSMTRARGTVGYIAPEVFCRNFGEVSHKSDVYSYGMMVLEIVGERRHIDTELGDSTNETYFPHWVYKHIEVNADEEDRDGVIEEDKKRKLTIVGLWCIQTDPKDRPSMRRVVEMLEGKLESLQIPPKPYLCSSTRLEVDVSTYESSI
ncbi:hypothetical protein BUALT_Bualt05G0124400 [Buddleja alternifolia]|uniref:Uncharacterized protein n=1 Tax=Buddleja alternifolia TaxID=168488 RepID=A0AAV6XIL8_9LAMI|nr:hypothetical protein BUALT_Bualt05G0124400 [Buddleja alternifolia]